MENNLLDIALEYHRHGFHVIPVEADKRPRKLNPENPDDDRRIAWRRYQDKQTERDVKALFSSEAWGLAILTGINGLEVIDVDQKYDPSNTLIARYAVFNDMNSNNAIPITNLTIQATKSGGFHLLYRCEEIAGNMKLAQRPALPHEEQEGDRVKVLIETRGTGGYIVAWPSPGYLIDYGDIWEVPTITPQQRAYLFEAARHFDEMPKQAAVVISAPLDIDHETPWADFDAKTNIVDLLIGYGWTFVSEDAERVQLKRPGQTDATQSGNWHKGKNLFVCHSTSTPLEPEKGYTAFGIYAAYEHGGDRKAAARTLSRQGYGTPRKGRKDVAIVTKEATARRMALLMKEYQWLSMHPRGSVPPWLRGRNVIIYPALGEESEWKKKAEQLRAIGVKVKVSAILDQVRDSEGAAIGMDIADFIAA